MSNFKVDKPWGHEIRWAINHKYLGKILYIEKGKRLSRQYHAQKDETIYVLKGTLVLEIGVPGTPEYNTMSTLLSEELMATLASLPNLVRVYSLWIRVLVVLLCLTLIVDSLLTWL